MKDNEHPFFRPLWRRIAVVVVCACWSLFEFWTGSTTWGMIAGAFTVYSAWQFLYAYKEPAAATQDASAPGASDTRE